MGKISFWQITRLCYEKELHFRACGVSGSSLPHTRVLLNLRDSGITGLRDYGITGLRDYGITGLRDYGITGLRDYGITVKPALPAITSLFP